MIVPNELKFQGILSVQMISLFKYLELVYPEYQRTLLGKESLFRVTRRSKVACNLKSSSKEEIVKYLNCADMYYLIFSLFAIGMKFFFF